LSNARLELTKARGRAGAVEVNEHVQGATPMPEYADGETDLKFDKLRGRRDAAITKMLKDTSTPADRAVASFLGSTYRDARYAAGGRRYLQTLGYGNAIRGHYEAAKQARDNGLE